MGTGHLAVDGTGVGAVLLDLSTVDKGNTLAKVPLGLLRSVHALQLDDGVAGALQVLAALVAEMASLDIETSEGGGLVWEVLGWRRGYRILFSLGIENF